MGQWALLLAIQAYFKEIPVVFQDFALHSHAGQFRSDAGQFHLLRTKRLIPSAFELALGAELDTVIKACFGDTEQLGRDSHRQSAFDQPDPGAILNSSVYLAY